MDQYIEFVGKNIDQALEKASNELDIPVERLKYDVVSYGSSGIFGLVGAKKAKIRVKNGDRKKRTKNTREQAIDLVKDAFQIEDEEPRRESAPKASPKVQPQSSPPPADYDQAIEVGTTALQRFEDFITNDTRIITEIKEQRLMFKVEGGNSAMLIGKRGQTLEAMQYLVEKIVNKQCEQRVRILVDVEGYLKTRKENLQKMASRMADKAQKTRKPVTIGQMNAYDRRTVHLHLKSNAAVRTQSVGEGYYRKLVIFPKKRRRPRASEQG